MHLRRPDLVLINKKKITSTSGFALPGKHSVKTKGNKSINDILGAR